jgi:antitoxin VapB
MDAGQGKDRNLAVLKIFRYPAIDYRYLRRVLPLFIRDDETAGLVAELARRRGLTKQDAVKAAVTAELKRDSDKQSVTDRLRVFWAANPLPPSTGLAADKAFFDDLSGDL